MKVCILLSGIFTCATIGMATTHLSTFSTTGCEIVWQYYRQTCEWDTGSVHLGIKNTADQAISISQLKVNGKALAWPESLPDPRDEIEASTKRKRWYFPTNIKAGDVMWFRFSRKEIPPGGMTELIVKFQKPPQRPVELEIETANGEVTQTMVEPKVLPVSITSITFSDNLSTVYIYVKNRGEQTQCLESVEINGQDKTADSTIVGRLIYPGRSGCIVVPECSDIAKGDHVYTKVKTKDGTVVGNSIRAFSCFIVPGQPTGIKFKGFTDNQYGQLDLVARESLQKQPTFQGQEMITFWTNQGFIKYGIMAFGELADCARVHCQPSEVEYLGKYRPEDPHYVQAKVRYIREALAPRPLFPETEVHHSLMSDSLQGLLSPVEMRLRVYYMISRGAKGIFYRGRLEDKSTAYQLKMLKTELGRIERELAMLKPLLRIGEYVEDFATSFEPLVEPCILLCGDKATIVILLNHDRQMSWPKNEMYLGTSFWIEPKPDHFEVSVNIPPEVQIKRVFEVGGRWSQPDFNVENGNCRFDVDGIVDTRIFVLSFGDHTRDDLIAQGFQTTTQEEVRLDKDDDMSNVDVLMGKIDVLIEEFVNAETSGFARSPWDPVVLAELRPDTNGPDIQFEEKQYFFDQLPPEGKWHWHNFYYRNTGKLPLEVTSLEKSDSIKVEILKPVLLPGERGYVRIGFVPFGQKMHSRILLKSNDDNEKQICLEIGGSVHPILRAVPEHLHFAVDLLSKEVMRKTIRLIDNGKGDLKIQSVKTSSDCISCDLAPITSDKVTVKSHADIFGGEYVQREFLLVTSVKKGSVRKSTCESLTVFTDKGDTLQIPVTLQVLNPIKCRPARLFFGTVKGRESKVLKISSRGLPFKVDTIDCDDVKIKTHISELEAQKLYEVAVTLRPGKHKGMVRGEIKILINCKDQQYSIPVPYFALIQ